VILRTRDFEGDAASAGRGGPSRGRPNSRVHGEQVLDDGPLLPRVSATYLMLVAARDIEIVNLLRLPACRVGIEDAMTPDSPTPTMLIDLVIVTGP
jgi:hypothetical protein